MAPPCARIPKRSRVGGAGFSLVELMVALVIGLLISAAMLTAYSSGSAATGTTARFAEVQTNGRYAVDFLRREIQLAGFLPLNVGPVQKTGTTGTADYGCGAGFAARIEEPIFGVDDDRQLPCIAATDYRPFTDVLVLRRAGLTPSTATAADNLYVRTEFMRAAVYVGGGAAPVNLQPPAEDYPLAVDVYYVSPYTSTIGDGVPALKRMTLGRGPAMTSRLIASGIENMQIQYGVQTGSVVNFVDAQAVADWPNVVAVRLWVLARSADAEYGGFSNASSYDMGNHTAASATAITVRDNFVRQAFPLVVNLRR